MTNSCFVPQHSFTEQDNDNTVYVHKPYLYVYFISQLHGSIHQNMHNLCAQNEIEFMKRLQLWLNEMD